MDWLNILLFHITIHLIYLVGCFGWTPDANANGFLTRRSSFPKPHIRICTLCRRHGIWPLHTGNDVDFWEKQKELIDEMSMKAGKSLKQEQLEKFAKRRDALIGDTTLFIALIFSLLWAFSDNPFVSFSYAFGSIFGLSYAYGLAKYVETLGGSAADIESVQGAGVGQARFAFLILLFVFVGKFRDTGLLEIPSILGFFTYQLASFSQGLREIND